MVAYRLKFGTEMPNGEQLERIHHHESAQHILRTNRAGIPRLHLPDHSRLLEEQEKNPQAEILLGLALPLAPPHPATGYR